MIRLPLIFFFSLVLTTGFSQRYSAAVVSVYAYKDLNEKFGKTYPKLTDLSHDKKFDLAFLADSLDDFLSNGYWKGFPFDVLEREKVVNEPHYHEYESHYFEQEDNPQISLGHKYKMFVLEETDYESHDVDELISIFPFLNSLITISLKFHLIHNNIDKDIIEIKPEMTLHFWDYKSETTHTASKSVVYVSKIRDWDPITDHPNIEILELELHRALNQLIQNLDEHKEKFIHKIEKKLIEAAKD